eukprot:COSAG02_NODE_4131_length_5739_cov_5.860993_4_plen_280_part_00
MQRSWYAFYNAEDDDDDAFEKRVDCICKEIGDRGRSTTSPNNPIDDTISLPEGLPPAAVAEPKEKASAVASTTSPSPAPALAPAPAPAPMPAPHAAPSRALATTTSERQSFSPTMQTISQPVSHREQDGDRGGSLAEVSVFMSGALTEMMEKQQLMITDAIKSTRAEMKAQLSKAETENAEIKANAQAELKAELKAVNADLKAERARLTASVISDEQLTAVQSRFETMHGAKLLTDDELFALEVSKSCTRTSWLGTLAVDTVCCMGNKLSLDLVRHART